MTSSDPDDFNQLCELFELKYLANIHIFSDELMVMILTT